MNSIPLSRKPAQDDALKFGKDDLFEPQKVAQFLQLDRDDVSRIADVPIASIRWDLDVPHPVKTCLREIGETANLVAQVFDGSVAKTALWFQTINPLLGNIAPSDMIRAGRHDRLRRFIDSTTDDDRRPAQK